MSTRQQNQIKRYAAPLILTWSNRGRRREKVRQSARLLPNLPSISRGRICRAYRFRHTTPLAEHVCGRHGPLPAMRSPWTSSGDAAAMGRRNCRHGPPQEMPALLLFIRVGKACTNIDWIQVYHPLCIIQGECFVRLSGMFIF